jgi:transcription antitermination factor NusG
MLGYKGYEVYLPKYRAFDKRGGKELSKKLFPGYLFCRFDPRTRGRTHTGNGVVTVPGIIRILGAGGMAIPIPDHDIESIRRILASDLSSQPWPFLRAGHHVEIELGPLRGVRGILLALEADNQLIVSVELLQRSLAVRIEQAWINPRLAVSEALKDCCKQT